MAVTDIKTYQAFRGVDYSASPAVISDEHASDMLNMYIGEDGVMQKRPGWHICMTFQVSPSDSTRLPIYGIHYMRFSHGNGMLFIHAKDRLYRVLLSPRIRHIDADVPYFRTDSDVPTTALASQIERYVAGIDDQLEEWQIRNLDVNGDGQITNADATIIANYIAGIVDKDELDRGIAPDSYHLVCTSEGSPVVLNDAKSVSFEHDGKLYILDGAKYWVVKQTGDYRSGINYVCDEVVGKIPTTHINGHYEYDDLNSAGTNPPGSQSNPGVWTDAEKNDPENLLANAQICTFIADTYHTEYRLPYNNCTVLKVEVRKKIKYYIDSNGDYQPYPDIWVGTRPKAYWRYTWSEIPDHDGVEDMQANPARMFYNVQDGVDGQSSVQSAMCGRTQLFIYDNGATPAVTDQTLGDDNLYEGENVRVTYILNKKSEDGDTEEKDKKRNRATIEKCNIVTRFGYYNDNRFILSGNPDTKNEDYMSEVDDPTYFPVNGWTKIGSDNTAIMGYLHYGTELAIIKEDNGIDATIYMRSAILTENNDIVFPVQQGAQGVGAISKWCIKALADDPLFLAKEGVFAIQGVNASQERNVPNRSFFIDKRLQKEIDGECVAEVFRGYYFVCNPLTGHCYVADSRYQSLPPGTNGRSHIYEWYPWDNIPAAVMTATDDFLYFGTKDGRLCAFNFDWDDNPKRWTDGAEYVNGSTKLHKWQPYDYGYQIHAYYVTKRDHLGVMDFKKTMLNDGGVITLKPHERSSASITITTDKGTWFVDQVFTDSDEPSVVVPIRHRFKNFDSIETRIENNENKEGLSILGVQYRYVTTTNRR